MSSERCPHGGAECVRLHLVPPPTPDPEPPPQPTPPGDIPRVIGTVLVATLFVLVSIGSIIVSAIEAAGGALP